MIKLWLVTFVGVAFQLVLLAVLLFAPIARFDWFEAQAWLATHAVFVLLGTVYFLIANPKAIEARMRFGGQTQPKEDKLATSLLVGVMILSFLACPVDVFYVQLLPLPPDALRWFGFSFFIFGLLLTMVTMAQNVFAAPTVHVQQEQGHHLVDTGLYAYMRHPMYAGFVAYMIGTFLWLGSWLTLLIATPALVLALRIRVLIEEKTLIKELKGYEAYTHKVQARFIPFLY